MPGRKLIYLIGLTMLGLGTLCLALLAQPASAGLPARAGAASSAHGSAPVGAFTATPTTTACAPWQVVPSESVPSGQNYLRSVSAVSPTDIWAVGVYEDSTGYSHTLTEHWDGHTWAVVASPDPGAHNNSLFGVAAISATNIWAVGWQASTNIQQPLVLHNDGSGWTEEVITTARARLVLLGISAIDESHIWAVGEACDGPMCLRRLTAVIFYNGTNWIDDTSSLNPAPYDNLFNAVSAVSPTDVWAVGEACTGNGCAASDSLVEHWDGSSWTVSTTPSPGAAGNPLFGVDARAGEAWAVGEACADGGCSSAQSLALHYTGGAWSEVPSPNPGTVDTHLNAVTLVSSDDAWAVGSYTSDGATYLNPVFHWNGSAWSQVAVSNPGSADNDLRGLARLSATDIWAVGDSSDGTTELTQVQHYTGPCEPASPSPTATATAAPATSTATAVASGTPAGTATPCAITFTDVPPENTFYPYVRCLACRGVLGGYSDGTFRPNNNITRGQIAKVVSNAAAFNDPIPQDRQTYTDVPSTNTFWEWIERLTIHGVMSGYQCGIDPNEPCDPQNRPYFRWANNATRAQLAKIDSNAAGYSDNPTGQTFTDVPTTHPFYVWIERLAERGIMGGYVCGGPGEPCDPQNRPYFRPYNNVTRGQAAKIVANTFYPNCQTPSRR